MAKVLLVEDDPWMADCYSGWLATEHAVRHARDAQGALDMIDDDAPDVIVLDLLLPHASGVQLLQTLQSHTDLALIPVVLCSGSLPAEQTTLAAYGVRRVLDKAGLGPRDLRQAISEVLAHAAV